MWALSAALIVVEQILQSMLNRSDVGESWVRYLGGPFCGCIIQVGKILSSSKVVTLGSDGAELWNAENHSATKLDHICHVGEEMQPCHKKLVR